MLTGYYQNNNKRFQKRLVKGTKFFLKKKKTKSVNMLMNDTDIFLKKKKRVNMVVTDIEILQKTKNKGKLNIENIILKCKKLIRIG